MARNAAWQAARRLRQPFHALLAVFVAFFLVGVLVVACLAGRALGDSLREAAPLVELVAAFHLLFTLTRTWISPREGALAFSLPEVYLVFFQ
jgi:hypothetical protein